MEAVGKCRSQGEMVTNGKGGKRGPKTHMKRTQSRKPPPNLTLKQIQPQHPPTHIHTRRIHLPLRRNPISCPWQIPLIRRKRKLVLGILIRRQAVAAELVAEFPVVRGDDAGGRGVHGEMRAVVVVLRVPFEAGVVPVDVLVAAGFGGADFLVRDGESVSEAGGGVVSGW